ncbi:response regulator transcription factor [Serratia proteamaculans]|jgi:FixJ family two-component response regulator|uniref:response regulator transcription factor n=3 Tax=Serratia proteamaculans TaxID=28151 RepID=UPI0021B775DB|nr:response regulator [Serratia proteamaculans]
MMEQRIYLIDHDAALRLSVTLLLDTLGWQVESYDNVANFQYNNPSLNTVSGCLLLDVRMPGKTGFMLLEEWRSQVISLPVILMAGQPSVEQCRRAFKLGVFDFLTKPVDADVLIETVGAALIHHRGLCEQYQKKRGLQDRLALLSARENQVYLLLMEGTPNKAIAQLLSLSPRTIEIYRANIFDKLAVDSAVRLIKVYGELR